MEFVSALDRVMKGHYLPEYGWVRFERPLSMDIYKQWLSQGRHAGMEYLLEHEPIKEDPRRLSSRAASAIVVAKPYLPHPYPEETPALKGSRKALYAQGEDYHWKFKAELKRAARDLAKEFPAEEFLCFTDSAPILERDLAHRAGLGWFGKNSCLIDRTRGSFFLLGQIVTSVAQTKDIQTSPDHCGTCDRCVRACPTEALTPQRTVDANRCISYWTIEAKGAAPEELRGKFGDWLFGCDICQTVCPWNDKPLTRLQKSSATAQDTRDDLRWLLRASHKQIQKRVKKTPLSRARPQGLKRNAIVVAANLGLKDLSPEIAALKNTAELAETATWALSVLEML